MNINDSTGRTLHRDTYRTKSDSSCEHTGQPHTHITAGHGITHLANANHRDITVGHGMIDIASAVDVVFCRQRTNSTYTEKGIRQYSSTYVNTNTTQKDIGQYSSSYVNTNTVVHAHDSTYRKRNTDIYMEDTAERHVPKAFVRVNIRYSTTTRTQPLVMHKTPYMH